MKKSTERQLLEHLGPLELDIMKAVWDLGSATVHDVLDRLNNNRGPGRDLVYNTVMSTMGRLHEKGYLDRRRDGKAYVYSGDGPEEFFRKRMMDQYRANLDIHGGLAVSAFADTLGLDDEDRRLLQQLADQND